MNLKRMLALVMTLCVLIGMTPLVGVSAEEYPSITPGVEQKITISKGGEVARFTFTPTYTESYTFCSIGMEDTYGYLYDSEMNPLTQDDQGGDYNNFSITYTLEAGKTYILGAKLYYDDEKGSFAVMLRANHTITKDGVVIKEPTCLETGVMTYTCDICGEKVDKSIPTSNHSWGEGFACVVCGCTIPAITTDTETTATIVANGEVVYFAFSPAYTESYTFHSVGHEDTQGYLYDSKMNELASSDQGGDYNNFSITYTMEAGKIYILGARYYYKDEIGEFPVVLRANHTITKDGVVTKVPTCLETGVMTYTCDVCGGKIEDTIPTAGHSWDENYACTVCKCSIPVIEKDTETTVIIAEDGEIAYFVYTPTRTAYYTFYSIGREDTCGYLYDSKMNELASNDQGGDYNNFSLTYTLEAGKTYILGAGYYYGDETGTFSVVLKASLLGDVNSDGEVNSIDRVYLSRYLAKWTDYPESVINMDAADVNGDGAVNSLDRVYLARHLAKWTGYEILGV